MGYSYYIVVTNSKGSDTAVLRTAQGRSNQENLIKDFKHGLGPSHVPSGVLAANQAYFLIAAPAWNLKTWMLNLLRLGDGAVMRCKRFLYLWINQAGVVSKSGRDTVVLKLPAGEYYQRFGTALARSRLVGSGVRCSIEPEGAVCPDDSLWPPDRLATIVHANATAILDFLALQATLDRSQAPRKPIPTNRSDNYCRQAAALSPILGLS